MEGLADANWKARLAACEEMQTWIEGVVEDVDAEVVVRAIAKKGWSEKNFQVRRSDLRSGFPFYNFVFRYQQNCMLF
jgi:hypothetical protein